MSVTLVLRQSERYGIGGFTFLKDKPQIVKDDKLAKYLRSLKHENKHPYFEVYVEKTPEPIKEAEVKLKESVFNEEPTDAALAELFDSPDNMPEDVKEAWDKMQVPDPVEVAEDSTQEEDSPEDKEEKPYKRGRPKKYS